MGSMLLDSSLCEMDSRKVAGAKTLREDASINTITSHFARFSLDRPKTLKCSCISTAYQTRRNDTVEWCDQLTYDVVA
jgi:hypothetical protein